MGNRFSERLEKVTKLLNECNDYEQRKLLEIEQEAWRTVNAMFEENNKELLKKLSNNEIVIKEQANALQEQNNALQEQAKLIEELLKKINGK
jgi:hypothetical protein